MKPFVFMSTTNSCSAFAPWPGRVVATFDGYAPKTTYGVAKTFGGLTGEIHTLRLVVLGAARRGALGTLVVVDGFTIG